MLFLGLKNLKYGAFHNSEKENICIINTSPLTKKVVQLLRLSLYKGEEINRRLALQDDIKFAITLIYCNEENDKELPYAINKVCSNDNFGLVILVIKTLERNTLNAIEELQDSKNLYSTIVLKEKTGELARELGSISYSPLTKSNAINFISVCFTAKTRKEKPKVFLGFLDFLEKTRAANITFPTGKWHMALKNAYNKTLYTLRIKHETIQKGKATLQLQGGASKTLNNLPTIHTIKYLLSPGNLNPEDCAIIFSRNYHTANNTREISRHDFAFRCGAIPLMIALFRKAGVSKLKSALSYVVHDSTKLKNLQISKSIIITDGNFETAPFQVDGKCDMSRIKLQITDDSRKRLESSKYKYHFFSGSLQSNIISEIKKITNVLDVKIYQKNNIYSHNQIIETINNARSKNAFLITTEADLLSIPVKYHYLFGIVRTELIKDSRDYLDIVIEGIKITEGIK